MFESCEPETRHFVKKDISEKYLFIISDKIFHAKVNVNIGKAQETIKQDKLDP